MANRKTRGIIFSVKKTEERSEEQWSKISWAYMTRGSGKGNRWKAKKRVVDWLASQPPKRKRRLAKKKRLKLKVYLEVVDVNDIPVCTWVKTKDIPLMVRHAMIDGAASETYLRKINQSNRSLNVPWLCHPLTMEKPLDLTAVTDFFTRAPLEGAEEVSPVRQAVTIDWTDFSGNVEIKHYDKKKSSASAEKTPPEKSSASASAEKTPPKKRARGEVGLRVCPQTGEIVDLTKEIVDLTKE